MSATRNSMTWDEWIRIRKLKNRRSWKTTPPSSRKFDIAFLLLASGSSLRCPPLYWVVSHMISLAASPKTTLFVLSRLWGHHLKWSVDACTILLLLTIEVWLRNQLRAHCSNHTKCWVGGGMSCWNLQDRLMNADMETQISSVRRFTSLSSLRL